MIKRWLVFPASVLFLLVVGLLLYPQRMLSPFSKQASIDPGHISGDYDATASVATYDNFRLSIPQNDIAYVPPAKPVLGYSTAPKHIEVDLSTQHLYAYEGDQLIYDFLISSGKWNRTPTGTFWIWTKLRYTRMKGGNPAIGTYYDLPNVPYVMFFYNDQVAKSQGFSLHGTYWHENFGHPMSHGCVNMKTEEAALIYYWADPDLRGNTNINTTEDNPGTPIIIYGEPPQT
jgi:hypothetical protein